MLKISRLLPRDKASLVEAYKKTAKTIGSDHEYRRVMDAIE